MQEDGPAELASELFARGARDAWQSALEDLAHGAALLWQEELLVDAQPPDGVRELGPAQVALLDQVRQLAREEAEDRLAVRAISQPCV